METSRPHDLTSLSVRKTTWELGREGSEIKEGCPVHFPPASSTPSPGGHAPRTKESHKMVLILIERGVQWNPAGHQRPSGGVPKIRKYSAKRERSLPDNSVVKCLSHKYEDHIFTLTPT